MRTEQVTVGPYDPGWPKDFEEIKQELTAALGPLALHIEHVGSTAVPGLAAKPIIDIDIVIEDSSRLPSVIKALSSLGYSYEGDLGIADREAFSYQGKEHLCTHHLYVCPQYSAELRRHLLFRDYLRDHPQTAAEYGALKQRAAALFPQDIDSYCNYKAPCIEKIYADIAALRSSTEK